MITSEVFSGNIHQICLRSDYVRIRPLKDGRLFPLEFIARGTLAAQGFVR